MSRKTGLTPIGRVHVVAGILFNEGGAVLIADRANSTSMPDYWEFPGGKVADGETPEQALRRELAEELGIEAKPGRHFHHIVHDYPDIAVAIDFYLVNEWQGTPSGREGQQVRWVNREDLDSARLLPADAPVIAALKLL